MTEIGTRPATRVLRGAALAAITYACTSGVATRAWAQHASAVLRYEPGAGYATEFGTGAGYTNAAAALGEPSRLTPGPFGGPVDPFSPPWQPDQVVSLGTGSILELQLNAPIRRDPAHPFGIDFLVFGGSGFVIVNGDYSGGGITDGSLFGQDGAVLRLSVADADGPWLTLDPAMAPALEGLFPTDGAGDFTRAVNPALKSSDFLGLGLDGIRMAYDGSGGGTGYSLAWARDASGQPAILDSATRIRFEVLSGRVEVDAVAAVQVVPEPGPTALGLGALAMFAAWGGTRLDVRRGGPRGHKEPR